MGRTGPRFPGLDEPFPPPFPLPLPGPPALPWPLSCPWPLLLGVPFEAPPVGLPAPVFLLPSAPVLTLALSVASGRVLPREVWGPPLDGAWGKGTQGQGTT
jgi:hypothetical protein